MLSRRGLIGTGAAGALVAGATIASARAVHGKASHATGSVSDLKPMIGTAKPISREEREARLAKAQKLMRDQGMGAMILEPGSAMDYFTGVLWHRSERLTAAVIPANGEVIIVTPHFEEPSVKETLAVPGEIRIWHEHESPFLRVKQALEDRGVRSGKVGVESTVRFFIVDEIRKASAGALELVSADPVTRACRMIKSPAEIELMQIASDVTMAAYAWVYPRVKLGMTQGEIASMMNAATAALGGAPEFALVLLNEASAYPHGSRQAQTVKDGGIVLMDCGCTVHGYQSDISRTWVHGAKPTARQRKVWETVKRGQEITLETARIGVEAHVIDDTVRAFYEKEGWGPGYKLPGLSHRVGHGIGLDGHEPAFFVGGDKTPLQAGMCFSDEPGIYIPGEFGVRLEDCLHMTESGPKLFSGLARSLENPI
jgi:Xaa-Pro dipeptidase